MRPDPAPPNAELIHGISQWEHDEPVAVVTDLAAPDADEVRVATNREYMASLTADERAAYARSARAMQRRRERQHRDWREAERRAASAPHAPAAPRRTAQHETRPATRRARQSGGTSRGEPASPSDDDDPGRAFGLTDAESRAFILALLEGHGGEIDRDVLMDAWHDLENDVREARVILAIVDGFVRGEITARWDTERHEFRLFTRTGASS